MTSEAKKFSYGDWRELIGEYWSHYGGWKAVLTSGYFHLSMALLIITTHQWIVPGWWEIVLQILPSLVGFSIGAYAILLTVGNDEFKEILTADSDQDESIYLGTSAVFVHFIVMQIIATLYALLAKGLFFQTDSHGWFSNLLAAHKLFLPFGILTGVFWAIGYLLFLYALCLVGAAALGIFRISSFYEQYMRSKKDIQNEATETAVRRKQRASHKTGALEANKKTL